MRKLIFIPCRKASDFKYNNISSLEYSELYILSNDEFDSKKENVVVIVGPNLEKELVEEWYKWVFIRTLVYIAEREKDIDAVCIIHDDFFVTKEIAETIDDKLLKHKFVYANHPNNTFKNGAFQAFKIEDLDVIDLTSVDETSFSDINVTRRNFAIKYDDLPYGVDKNTIFCYD